MEANIFELSSQNINIAYSAQGNAGRPVPVALAGTLGALINRFTSIGDDFLYG
jgi:hypothetical protein